MKGHQEGNTVGPAYTHSFHYVTSLPGMECSNTRQRVFATFFQFSLPIFRRRTPISGVTKRHLEWRFNQAHA